MNTERFEDHYETLGVSRNASVEEIRQAKRRLSKLFHPDLVQEEALKDIYGSKLAKINNAADVLLNPQKKYEYDLEWDAHKMEKESQRRRRPYYEQAGTQYTQGSTYGSQRQGYERHFYDYETDQTYTSYEQYEQQSQQRQEQRQQQRQSSRTEQTRRARGYTSKHAKKGFFEDIRQAAREVREDEKRRKTSARRAHANVNNFVNRKFSKNRNVAEEILCAISKGTLHICVSTLRELSKLGYIAKDSFPKFVIRNRRMAAMGAAAVILFSSFGATNDKEVIIPETPSITISDSTLTNDQEDQFVVEDNQTTDPLEGVFQEEEQVTEYVAKRYHKVVAGDTLSGLAEQAGCSIETIQRENYITGSLIKIGETLVIPYEFTSEDYKYATIEVQVPTGKTLREIAQEYNTDVATIIRLNEDNVIQSQGNYYVITDTVRVPNFATPSQIKEAREADLAYSKRQ